jgi:hypothetical protein
MTAKDFIAIGDAFRYTRPYVPSYLGSNYRERVEAYRQWLEDVGTVAKQIATVSPKFNAILWIDYVHGFVNQRGKKIVNGREVSK